MQLVNFSVTNYRSITKAHKINLQNITVLVGRNNETLWTRTQKADRETGC